MSGRLVILSGPSGVGKDTLIEKWREADPRVQRVVACTTRQPRAGEVDGVDYHFVDADTFAGMAEGGAFLEHKRVHSNWYATPLAEVDRLLAQGKIAVLKIDVQGGLEVLRKRGDAQAVFILPPSMEELERRIRGRGTDGPEVVEERLRNARTEIQAGAAYPMHLVNADVDTCVKELLRSLG